MLLFSEAQLFQRLHLPEFRCGSSFPRRTAKLLWPEVQENEVLEGDTAARMVAGSDQLSPHERSSRAAPAPSATIDRSPRPRPLFLGGLSSPSSCLTEKEKEEAVFCGLVVLESELSCKYLCEIVHLCPFMWYFSPRKSEIMSKTRYHFLKKKFLP